MRTGRLFSKHGLRWLGVVATVLALTGYGMTTLRAEESGNAEEQELPDPEDIAFTTSDGLKLNATYYPGTEEKDSVPVILLHMLHGSRIDYADLAQMLQENGHAVLVPDLRGHAESTKHKGSRVPLKSSSLSRLDYAHMVQTDLPRLKRFLVAENNDKKLNIEKLCVVGAGLGASVALNWTAMDWSLEPVGVRKQGQDVKALVLISPNWSTPGLSLRAPMTARPLRVQVWGDALKNVFKDPDEQNFAAPVALDFRKEVSVLIVVGKGKSKAVGDARRLHKMFKTHHPESFSGPPDLFYGAFDTSLQGTKLLDPMLTLEIDDEKRNLKSLVAMIIKKRAADRSLPWQERKDPYD